MNDLEADGGNGERWMRELEALVPAPPSGGNTVSWAAEVGSYGHGFPDDYRSFMGRYGEGVFDDFIVICAPASEVYGDDASIRRFTADARHTAEMEGYPEPDSLIGFGYTLESDLLCWRAVGRPNE